VTNQVKKMWISFDDGILKVGSWNLPDPNTDPAEFNRISADIGWHICYSIASGAKKCEFKSGDMER
jgi:hypothetical protein